MPSPSVVHIVIDDSTSKVITGTYEYDRTNDGKLIVPAYSGYPPTPSAGEMFWDTATNSLYRRNDGNTAWEAVEALAAHHASTHEIGGDDLVSHSNLTGKGTNTHTQIDTHIADATKHRIINDSGTSATELWSASKINTALGGITYTNASTTPEDVGGIAAGSTFSAVTMQEMWDDLLYPYQDPTFSSFSISGQSSTLEVGDSIPASVTFTWGTTNSGNVSSNSLIIRDVTGASDLATGLADDSSEAIVMSGAIQLTAQGSYVFRIRGTDTDAPSKDFQRDATYNWRWKFYWGTSATTTLTEAQIESLPNGGNGLYSSLSRTYSLDAAASQYKYICYPATLGTLSTFTDTSTMLAVPFEAPYTVSVTNSFGQTTNYNVYKSTNMLGGAMNIAVT